MQSGLAATEVFWGLLLLLDISLLAWVVIVYLRRDLDTHHNDAEPAESSSEPPEGSLRDWLDSRANILVSRRRKHHKHHHKRHHLQR
jgi:hypothetical protein